MEYFCFRVPSGGGTCRIRKPSLKFLSDSCCEKKGKGVLTV
jgi:hypothetical protein